MTKVIRAFSDDHVWQQAELARHLGIEARRLRTILLSLSESGMPLVRTEEHPHIFWAVPKDWFPGGVYVDEDEWDVLLQAVLHVPDETRRKKVLTRLFRGRVMGDLDGGIQRLEKRVPAQAVSPKVHQATLLVQQAVLESRPLRMEYYSASSGKLTERVVSPQKLITEPHPRLVAYCHSNHELRWFRLDNIQSIELDRAGALHEVDMELVERHIAASPDGFHDGTETEWSFVVSASAAAWVKGNLLPGMQVANERSDGMRVVARGGALVVARFVVGLGGQAIAEQPQLRDLVRELAERSLTIHRD